MPRPFTSLARTSRLIACLAAATHTGCLAADTAAHPAVAPDAEAEQLTQMLRSLESTCTERSVPWPGDEVFTEPKVFLEAALIAVPTQAQLPSPSESISALARVPGARWIGSPHILAAFNATAQMQFGHLRILAAPPTQPELSFAGMSVRPLAGIPDTVVLEVDIELTLTTQATPTSTATTQSVHVRNSFATHDRKATSVTLPVPSSPEASLFVALVPRVLRSSADLRDIFNCKVRQRQAYLNSLNRTRNAATVPQQQH